MTAASAVTEIQVRTRGGNDVVLYNFQPVPEPAGLLALLAGAAAVVWRRSARRGIAQCRQSS